MLLSAPLWFLLCWKLPGGSVGIHPSSTPPPSPWLGSPGLTADAVDDMYFGCGRAMATMVKDRYFQKEKAGQFGDVWEGAAGCADSKLKQRDPEDQALTKDHLQAICVYTSRHQRFHAMFDDAVRRNVKDYRTGFLFHSFHFWLTSALQILNENKRCQKTYLRTNHTSFSGKVNEVKRFGFFASSSFDPTLKKFGRKTCFKIRTCAGGFLKRYSAFGDSEQEVLIPPYEMFRITAKKKGRDVKEMSDCKAVFLLESAGVHSSLNCRAVNF